jgi:hypothetical protein
VIAIINNGVVERVVYSTQGENLAGRTTLDLPGDYDPVQGNYVLDGGAFVPNIARAKAMLRAARDQRLAASDWTQLQDTPNEISRAWKPYRQALRDLPDTTADPFAPQWPSPPA